MRRAAFALLLFAGCASGGSNHELSVTVFEAVSRSQRPADLGLHSYQIRIENKSHQMVVVHTIEVESGSGDFQINEPPQEVETTIGPGTWQDFEVMATVDTIVSPSRMSQSTRFPMDSLRLTIGCTSESGNFTESGSYSITRRPND